MKTKYCERCDRYTLEDVCSCGKKTKTRSPPKFKPDDRYGQYRRKAKWKGGK